ncbi:mitochondrial ribosomal protein MRPL25 [Scheffersomyces xylosifermentans]|uniref:mitochondrial ribosomal protein MRPL25 n=1 Tax=Scheffersomyces xylosifermentans TaxID=1304137 RepID=UPI00315C5126
MSLTAKEAFAKLPQKLHNFFIKYPPRPFAQYSEKPSTIVDPNLNPFYPNKNPETGRWHGAKYSLRRSSDLYKMARKFGIQDLLPPLPKKFYEEKYFNKNWMRGVLTQKKRKWERDFPEKLEAREQAIAKMDETIAAARPRYKKQLEKKQQREKTWF